MMKTKTERFIEGEDRSAWGAGPWQDEPDKAQFVDEATGLPCLIVRNVRYGHLCGYVGVPPDHPWFEVVYHDVDVAVHGGLTYSDFCQDDGHICHEVEPGEDGRVWWLGFDCAHPWDLSPGLRSLVEAARKAFGMELEPAVERLDETYRDWQYVEGQVRLLAEQVKDAERSDVSS